MQGVRVAQLAGNVVIAGGVDLGNGDVDGDGGPDQGHLGSVDRESRQLPQHEILDHQVHPEKRNCG